MSRALANLIAIRRRIDLERATAACRAAGTIAPPGATERPGGASNARQRVGESQVQAVQGAKDAPVSFSHRREMGDKKHFPQFDRNL